MTKQLVIVGVPIKFIVDSSMAYTMVKVNLVIFRPDDVVESGGIINMMGTYEIALVADNI